MDSREPTNKHSAVWDWLQNCPYIADLFFNHTQTDNGDTSLVPSDEVVREYLDGSSLRNYNVALAKVLPVSFEPNDTANIEQLVDFEALGDWIEAQNLARNFPNFPPGECVEEIRVLPSSSGYMVAQDMRSAKYQLQFQIEYTREYMREGR